MSIYWALHPDVHSALQAARELPEAHRASSSVEARQHAPKRVGNTAVIPVRGILSDAPDMFATFLGMEQTTYPSIIAALQAAQADTSVTNIQLDVSGPGGEFSGLFPVVDAMAAVTKPIHAQVDVMAASATYAVAAAADTISVNSRATLVGSVGVVRTFHVDSSHIEVTSSNAPMKRPDVTTEAGRAGVVAELDKMHVLFASTLAEGRGTTLDKVNANFGRGGMLLPDEALAAGMIDSVAAETTLEAKTGSPDTTAKGPNTRGTSMDLKTLKAEHPGVFAEAVEVGQTQERARALDHLTLGAASGDNATAHDAIKTGASVMDMQAKYLAASMTKSDLKAAEADSTDAGDELTSEATNTASDSEKVLAAVQALMGVDTNA